MTDDQLLAVITADSTAKALADAGSDGACAARMVAILPPVPRSNLVTERGLYDAFVLGGLQPIDAEAILVELATLGQSNPVLARVSSWLSPAQGGLDMGSPATQAELAELATANSDVFTAPRMAVLVALGQQPAQVSAADVSRVYAVNRPDGKVT